LSQNAVAKARTIKGALCRRVILSKLSNLAWLGGVATIESADWGSFMGTETDGMPPEEKSRREIFARLVAKGYLPPKPERSDIYSSSSTLPMKALPEGERRRLGLTEKIKELNISGLFDRGPT